MRLILLDEGVPVGVRQHLEGFKVDVVAEVGWAGFVNGDLIAAAEKASYEVLVTTDQNMQFQQNLAGRAIALVVLSTTQWPAIRPHIASIRQAVEQAKVGSYSTVTFPRLPLRRRKMSNEK